MKTPRRRIRNFVRKTAAPGSGLLLGLALALASGAAGPAADPSGNAFTSPTAAPSGPVAALVSGRSLSPEDVDALSRAVISIEDKTVRSPEGKVIEVAGEGGVVEKKIYLLKLDTGTAPRLELLQLQKRMLENQLLIMRVLGVVVKHQELQGQRLARSENLSREMLLGLQDTGHAVDMSRADIAATAARTGDIAEMSKQLTIEMEKVQKELSNIDAQIADIADIAENIEGVVLDIQNTLQQ